MNYIEYRKHTFVDQGLLSVDAVGFLVMSNGLPTEEL